MNRKVKGAVIIPAGLDVWEHELKTAQVFALNGHNVELLLTDPAYRMKSADVLIDRVT